MISTRRSGRSSVLSRKFIAQVHAVILSEEQIHVLRISAKSRLADYQSHYVRQNPYFAARNFRRYCGFTGVYHAR